MWGSLDASATFMRRVIELGAKKAMPADFPNLVLSSGAGHVSIFHQLRGPAWTVSAFDASGLSAVASGVEEIDAGRADVMVGGAVETTNDVVLRVLEIFRGEQVRASRSEGAAAVLLEAEDLARARCATILARVALASQRTWVPGGSDGRGETLAFLLADLVRVVTRPRLYVSRRDELARAVAEALSAETVVELEPRAGSHEAIGAVGAALAALAIGRGEIESAVILQEIEGALWAVALVRA
jgi:3-oxoacyl-[acyl-carrier-protein] synthase II